MNKNIKRMFFVLTLITLLATAGTVCAADDTNSTTADSCVSDATISDSVSNHIEVEPVATSDDNKVDTRTMEKENKNLKTSTKTVEVNNYDELSATINNAVQDAENNEYIINLNEGTYQITKNILFNKGTYTPKIIINGNNQILTADTTSRYIEFKNECDLTLNNVITTHKITFWVNSTIMNSQLKGMIDVYGSNLNIINSSINNTVNIYRQGGLLTIDDNTVFGEKFILQPQNGGKFIYNDSNKIAPYLTIYDDDYVLENVNIVTARTNNGNLLIKNSTLNATITNNGNLTLADDVIFGDNLNIMGKGNVTSNNSEYIKYLSTYEGENIINDFNFTKVKTNNGKLIINNSIINAQINNNGNLTIRNSTLNYPLSNTGDIFIEEDCIINDNFQIFMQQNSRLISNISNISSYITQFNGEHILENATITKKLTVGGTLTIKNTLVNAAITNYGKILFYNSTLNNTITQGTFSSVTISDDTKLGENFQMDDNNGNTGTHIVNASNERLPYFKQLNNGIISNIETTRVLFGTNLTIINATTTKSIRLENSTIINTNINARLTVNNTVTVIDSVINAAVVNNGKLIIGDETNITDNFSLSGNGQVIINDTNKIAPFINEYYGNITIENKTITGTKTNFNNLTIMNSTVQGKIINNGNTTLINSIIKSNIENNGNLILINCSVENNIINNDVLTINDDTTIGDTIEITGKGKTISDNITKFISKLSTINGEHNISNIVLEKDYYFGGNISLKNCTILSENNMNYAILNITDSTIPNSENSTWIKNFGIIILNNNTNITRESIENYGEIYENRVPENFTYKPSFIINNSTLQYYFKTNSQGTLEDIITEGDILDFQGIVTPNRTLTINKPVNMISSTNDAYIELNTGLTNARFIVGEGSQYTNITGITFHNTLFAITSTHHVTVDNVTAIVENQTVGTGTGQFSIRGNSTYVTIKNSYIYTKGNGGSSSLVLAWADYCTILNNTIIGGGDCGNLLYLTTYGATIPEGVIVNHDNKILNNTLIGPDEASGICVGFVLSGTNNTFDGNTINYSGTGIMYQWGSGIDEDYSEESEIIINNNTISNNKLYNGSGISGGNLIYNNYIEQGTLGVSDAIVYNNTAKGLIINDGRSEIINNTINGETIINGVNRTYTIISNNTLNGNINIRETTTNITITGNNITGTINLNGSSNIITNNTITTTDEYTITTRKSNNDNIITDNYLIAKTLTGDKSVNLNKETNTIENNRPYENKLKVDTTEFTAGQNTTITASIYNGQDINTTINKGKVTFKVNGKTLKDANGKVIYAKVVNGTATIADYEIPESWTKENTTIEAVLTGCTQTGKLKTEKTPINVTTQETTITTNDATAPAGSTITLNATINSNTQVTGKVVFKVNGKTVKDANGKVIYAKVVNNTVSVEYTLPESMKAGSYNITAVLISSTQDKLEDVKTLTVA